MQKGEMVQAGHLGGYIVGGDDATFYPDMWTWLVEHLKITSVVDVGCGEGHAMDYFKSLGVPSVLGVDGVATGHVDVFVHDYTTGPLVLKPYDLCWSCEFVEHVEERFLPYFLATFSTAKWVCLTHAQPGQVGHHHVNCRPAEYWTGAMAAIGFALDQKLTTATRAISALNRSPYNHYLRSGLVFSKSSEVPRG